MSNVCHSPPFCLVVPCTYVAAEGIYVREEVRGTWGTTVPCARWGNSGLDIGDAECVLTRSGDMFAAPFGMLTPRRCETYYRTRLYTIRRAAVKDSCLSSLVWTDDGRWMPGPEFEQWALPDCAAVRMWSPSNMIQQFPRIKERTLDHQSLLVRSRKERVRECIMNRLMR